MPPAYQQDMQHELTGSEDGERLVISGMSGLYPECYNVQQLSEMLYNKVNPVGVRKPRWKLEHPEVPQYTGKIPGVDRFDAQFFKVHFQLSHHMDAIGRKVLEQTYQAIYDAGVTAEHIYGKNIGVFVGVGNSESEKASFFDSVSTSGFNITGNSKTMFANRISYWINAKGPSMSIDCSCCSSLAALEQAYLAIKHGECEAAVVVGCCICLHPMASLYYGRMMPVAMDGNTRSFDQNAAGLIRSEAINVLFVQKAKDALRVYAEVAHVKAQFGCFVRGEKGPRFGFYRDPKVTVDFLKQFYNEASVPPHHVEYVEAFGSAVPEVDKSELEAIDEVFCKNRKEPLSIGSVISNIGFTEGASGLSAITKVLLGYHHGKFAANLHYNNPRQDIEGIANGRLKVIADHKDCRPAYSAVNAFSVTGVNAHVLLRRYYKPKDLNRYKSDIPRLVFISGRQESAVQKIIDDLKARPIDAEELALLHNIHEKKIPGHMARGYIVLDTKSEQTVSLAEKVDYFDDVKRPLWFVYSGMGSQWPEMGAQFMRIPTFAAAIARCDKVLKPNGIDIVHILTSPDKNIFENIMYSFVGITAVQIGLTDVLLEMGLVPEKFLGHSMGELGCAYCDGCMTAEETILASYSRGLVSIQTPLIRGSMAAVGIGFHKIAKLCPPEIEVACHNSPESSTISGPADIMSEFVAKLTSQGIFAKEVPCSNIAYHSRYIAEAGPKLLEHLGHYIKDSKLRSERWLSTSLPMDRWNESQAKYSSAWYHTNNLLSPVLFEETLRLVPSNAVLVEIAPHGLLQAILKRALPSDCKTIPLTRRGHADNVLFLLESLGRLYTEGFNPKIKSIYPKVEFPVSTGTPLLSHLVEWSHTEKWKLSLYYEVDRYTASICNSMVSIYDDENRYLQGHVVRGKMAYPFSACLVAVWDTLAMTRGVPKKQLSVEYRDVHLFVQPVLHDQRQLRIKVTLHRGTGHFEIMDEFSQVATGYINVITSSDLPKELLQNVEITQKMDIESQDIYELLQERDYTYSGDFQTIRRANVAFTEAQIAWNDNWVTFIDGILQLNVLNHSHDTVSLPRHIDKLTIDVKTHENSKMMLEGNTVIIANVSQVHYHTRCGGVFMENLQFYNLPPLIVKKLTLKPLKVDNIDAKKGRDCSGPCSETEAVNREVTLQSGEIGNVDSLKWMEMPELRGSGITVTVHYAGINGLDVKRAIGVIPFKSSSNGSYGMDYSGTTDRGERVMGMVPSGAASGRVLAMPELLWPVPVHWSLEDAATVPSAYAQAFYCLGIKSQLYPGMSVLVHGGAGALGQAAISIALANRCKVFTTVGDVRKKHFLRKLFPALKDEHIGNSRDDTFGDMVLQATNGNGCDFVISCVRGELKNTSLKCASYCGITFDTAQAQSEDSYTYGMYYMTKQRSYVLVDFTDVFNYKEDMEILQAMMSEGIAKGYVRPLSRVTYAPNESSRAFRLVAASRHRGRVLIRLSGSVPAQTRLICQSDHSHLIICDNDGFGLQLANRLVTRGARRLHLRCSKFSNLLEIKIQAWQKLGVSVDVSFESLNCKEGVTSLLSDTRTIPMEGVYVFVSNVADNEKAAMSTLISNLDTISREICPSIRYFAVINFDDMMGKVTCLDRANSQLPATMLHMSTSTKVSWRSVMDGVESALCSKEPLLVAQLQSQMRVPLLNQLAVVADLNITDNMKDSVTLNSLGMDYTKSQEVHAFLQNIHSVFIAEEKIPFLTIETIRDMEKILEIVEFNEVKGLDTFFSYVDPNELNAAKDMVFLPTLTIPKRRQDERDFNQAHLCVIPGLDGQYQRFTGMSERLKLPAVVLQRGLDNQHETIQGTAQRFAQIILKNMKLKDNFYLMGYESGVLIALEIAAILEAQGTTGTVFCLGGIPEDIMAMITDQLSMDSEESLQNSVALHMSRLIAGYSVMNLENEVKHASSWREKVGVCVQALKEIVPNSRHYIQLVIENAYARIGQVRDYRVPTRALRSRVVVLRACCEALASDALQQQYSQEPTSIYDLSAPLPHVVKDPRCATIINRNLGTDILDAYENMNLCRTYILNPSSFTHRDYMEDEPEE